MTIFVVAAGLGRGVSALTAAEERSNVASRLMVLITYSAIFNALYLYVYTVASQPAAF